MFMGIIGADLPVVILEPVKKSGPPPPEKPDDIFSFSFFELLFFEMLSEGNRTAQ